MLFSCETLNRLVLFNIKDHLYLTCIGAIYFAVFHLCQHSACYVSIASYSIETFYFKYKFKNKHMAREKLQNTHMDITPNDITS